jgi:hypothetical protein
VSTSVWGPDLVVTGPDGRHHIIPGYFSSEKHPALVAPNGASLTPDVVDLLAGSPTPGQYAQAQPTTPADSIGKVEKVIGSVTVVRNGVAVALHVGDAVYKSDVVQTGANSSVGIGFPDGTALNLVANTRMALNDYSFDASGTSNSALFTLVEGTFAFVAGKVAHDGNMKVATPVATMGIRGTTVYFASVTSSLGEVQYLAQLFADYQTGHVGAVEWFDNNPASPTYGQLIDTITDTGYAHYFTPRLGQSPLVNVQPATASQLQNDIISALSHLIDLINNGNQSTTPNSGSSTLPDIDVPHVFQPNGGNNPGPFTFNFVVPGLTAPIFITVVPLQTTTQILTSLPSSNETQSNPLPPPPGTIVWTSSESGPWNTGGNWNSGNVPGQINNVEIDQRVAGKPLTVTVADSEAANNLVIGRGVILHIDSGGFLFVANRRFRGGPSRQRRPAEAHGQRPGDGRVRRADRGVGRGHADPTLECHAVESGDYRSCQPCNHHHRPQGRQHQRRRDRRAERRSDHAKRERPRFHQSILDRGVRRGHADPTLRYHAVESGDDRG